MTAPADFSHLELSAILRYDERGILSFIMRQIIIIFLCFFVLEFSAGVPAVSAETLNREVFLKTDAMKKGYTMTSRDGDFSVGIRAGTFSGEGWIKIKEPEAGEFPGAPAGWKMISDVNSYSVFAKATKLSTQPIWVSLAFDSSSAKEKRIAFVDTKKKIWKSVETKVDDSRRVARAALPFGFARVVVLEKDGTSAARAPIQTNASLAPSIDAEAAIVVDRASGTTLYEKNADTEWWLASLTKLMTAQVFLGTKPDLSKTVAYTEEDRTIGGRIRHITNGEKMTLKDALYATLIGSANDTAKILGRSTSYSTADFLEAMKTRAKSLGLSKTTFGDFAGLSLENRSTAREYSKVVSAAAEYFPIRDASLTPSYAFTTSIGTPHTIKNTNTLLGKTDFSFRVAKTGYLDEAKNNFTGIVSDAKGNELVIVIFGSSTGAARFQSFEKIAAWAYANWKW